jgi:hypothetical protein
VSCPHLEELIELQPGQKRRRRRAQYGSLGAAVAGEAGRFHVTGTMELVGLAVSRGQGRWRGTRMAPGVTTHHLVPESQRVARSKRGVDAAQEEGDATEPENSDRENISGGDGDGVTAAPKGAMTMSRDLMPPPHQARNFGLIKPRYPSLRVRRNS